MFYYEGMKDLAHSNMRQVWGRLTDIGMFMSGLLGFHYIWIDQEYNGSNLKLNAHIRNHGLWTRTISQSVEYLDDVTD